MYISIHATLKTSYKILHACISISLSGQNFLFYLTPSHVHLLISNIDVAKRKLFWKCTRSEVGITLLLITLHFPGYHWLLNTFLFIFCIPIKKPFGLHFCCLNHLENKHLSFLRQLMLIATFLCQPSYSSLLLNDYTCGINRKIELR